MIEGTTRITFSGTSGIKTERKSASSVFRRINCTVSIIIPSSEQTSAAKGNDVHYMISEDGRCQEIIYPQLKRSYINGSPINVWVLSDRTKPESPPGTLVI